MPAKTTSAAWAMRRLALAAAALLALATPVAAQDTNPAPPAVVVDEASLRSFAAAVLQINAIAQEWSARIGREQDPARIEAMREDALTDIVEAVRDEGLTVDEYTAILQVAQTDPAINARVQEFMREEVTR
jgi:hypothetical protein